MTQTQNKPTCWVVTEGMAGTENQCLGVAEALGLIPQVKRIGLNQPWKALSPTLGLEAACTFDPPLEGPWPDLLLASGRKSIAAARYIKKASGGKTFTVQIQDPRVRPDQFDLVAVPEHDPTRGANVLVTDASPNRITAEKLATAKEQFAPLFSALPAPRVAVLIGGTSKAHQLTPPICETLVSQLRRIDGGLMITASRRTGDENARILQNGLQGDNIYFWDGSGDNPYFGMLAWADYILVTSDSASMLSDAATTGKPVYMIPLEGGSKRFDKFHDLLVSKGVARVFDGTLENWNYTAFNDAGKIAAEIRKRLPIT